MLRFHGGNELFEEPPHRLCAVPADHIGRDFIADQVGEDGRVAPTTTYACYDGLADLPLGCRAVEKSNVL